MFRNISFWLAMLIAPLIFGCSGSLKEVITSNPPGAEIYWGKSETDLTNSQNTTPHSRTVSSLFASGWEAYCFQVRMEGYNNSEVICRPNENNYRHIDFTLEPIKTTITSDPPGAVIYWGPSRGTLEETIYRTPRIEDGIHIGANYKNWYFQVKKEGYLDSEIIFKPRSFSDREIHFELKPRY